MSTSLTSRISHTSFLMCILYSKNDGWFLFILTTIFLNFSSLNVLLLHDINLHGYITITLIKEEFEHLEVSHYIKVFILSFFLGFILINMYNISKEKTANWGYLVKLRIFGKTIFQSRENRKALLDKQKLREFITMICVQEILRGIFKLKQKIPNSYPKAYEIIELTGKSNYINKYRIL